MSISFLNNWFVYGAVVAVLGGAITIQLYGRKIGYANLKGKHYAIFLFIWMLPTIVLPFLLMPMPIAIKIITVIGLIPFLALKYYVTTEAQNNMAELRRLKNKDKENQEEERKDDSKL